MKKSTNIVFALAIAHTAVFAGESAPLRIPAKVDFSTCNKPTWPKESLAKEEAGAVILSFLISTEGKVIDAKVLQTSGKPLLDQAAMEGIRQCRFSPITVGGKAVEDWQRMQYIWALEDPSREEIAAHELLRKQDFRGAAKMMRVAAEKGRPQAQFKLAGLLVNGDGVEQDAKDAVEWLKKSAAQMYAPAMGVYGTVLLKQGNADKEAFDLLSDGAAKEDTNSMYMLGVCYEEGRGTAVDLVQAKHWYARAATKGHAEAQAALDEINQASK